MRNFKAIGTILFLIGLHLVSRHSFSQTVFAPNQISGLSLWLTGDSVKTSNFPFIDSCIDLSAFNNNAIQNNIAKKPVSVISNLNNHKIMRFDGTDDFMSFKEIDSIRSLFIVIKHSTGTSSDYPPILGHRSAYDFIGSTGTALFGSSFVSPFVSGAVMKQNMILINPLTAIKPTNFTIISLVTSGNTKAEYITNDRNSFGVWNGDFAEIIIYNQPLNTSQTVQVEGYLHKKYSPILNLGADIFISQKQGCVPSNTITIQANPDFQSFLWNTGSTTNQINVNQYGEYSVICSDIFGINHYDTIRVRPSPKNFNYPSSDIICGNGSITWNTQLNTTENQFQWQDNSTDSLLIINSPGQYFVTVTDTFGCVYNSNTVTISQDNFASSISLGPDTSLCAGNSITLTNGASSSLTYTWNNGSTNDSLVVNTSGQYSVVVTNTNNCIAMDTLNITIKGLAPVTDFSTSIGCDGSPVSFTNLSSAPGNTISVTDWNFGDTSSAPSNTSTATNPFHTFSDTGTYTVRLNVITAAGCEQAITKSIHISPTPTATFSIGSSCQNDTTSFTNLSTSPAGYPVTGLTWNFGDGSGNLSGISNPKHVFANQSNYFVKLIVTNSSGCKDSLVKTANVKPEVKADFTYSTPCTNTTTLFLDNSIASSSAPSTRQWNFGTPPILSGLAPTRTYTASGPYLVTLTVSVSGCTSSISKIITIFSPPAPSFTIPTSCLKDTVTAINSSVAQSGTIASYNWELNTNYFSSVQNPTLSLLTAGSYSVKLTVVNSFGCKESLTKTITVYPLPTVDFVTNPSTYFYINSPINFIPTITNANSYQWTISSLPTATVQSPSYTFNTEDTYTVTLNLIDQQGCKNSKTKSILVSRRYLDLAILNVNTIKDDDGFMTVEAEIANYGTIPVSTFDIHYKISDGGNNKETWNGTLIPKAFFTYTFNSKSASVTNSENNITCVDIETVNGIVDENQTNNSLCNVINTNEIAVSNPIPNPTEEDITLPVILNKEIEFSITIYNSNGQLQYETSTQKGTEGLNLILLPTSSYSRGVYIIKTVIDDKIFIKKFIKISNK